MIAVRDLDAAATAFTALGFTLTLVTIYLVPHWVDAMGWRYAFVPLSIGPAIGVLAMAMLRAELPGYADYASRVRYRLVPGLY